MMLKELKGAAVECLVGNDLFAGGDIRPDGRGDGAHAGDGYDGCLAAFQFGKGLFQCGAGRVSEAGIDITGLLQREAGSALGGGIENKGGRVVDRRDQGAVCVLLGASVNGFRGKSVLLLVHIRTLLRFLSLRLSAEANKKIALLYARTLPLSIRDLPQQCRKTHRPLPFGPRTVRALFSGNFSPLLLPSSGD